MNANLLAERKRRLTLADQLWAEADEKIDQKYYSVEPKDDGGAIAQLQAQAEKAEREAHELYERAWAEQDPTHVIQEYDPDREEVLAAHDKMGRI